MIPAVGYEKIKEVVSVHVITNPTSARHLEIPLGHRVEVHLPLLVRDCTVDVSLALPHLLHGDSDFSMRFLGVVDDLKSRPTLAIWVARVRE